MINPMTLEGRNIIVTGAGKGIGRALSKLIIDLGGRVGGVDVSADDLNEGVQELGDSFLPLVGSVSDHDFVKQAVAQSIEHFGAIHGLVNNAGIGRPAMLAKMTLEQWQAVIDVHLSGSFYFTQEVGKHMIDQSKAGVKAPGSIIYISSDAGRRGTIGQVNYASAKSGMFGMGMSAAREWAKYNIRSNIVCFGSVETQMTEKIRSDEKLLNFYMSQTPLGRWATPEEVSQPVCFLLSEAASYITGQVLSVNGGYTITV